MDRKSYRWCVVPQCTNTSKTTPEKLFIIVPPKAEIRRNWLRLARRYDATQISTNTSIYFCEDHFDLPNDMENYTQYKIMGSVKKIRMKAGCIPSKLNCPPARKRTLQPSTSAPQSAAVKSRKIDSIQGNDDSAQVMQTLTDTFESAIVTTQYSSSSKSDEQYVKENITDHCRSEEKAVQTCLSETENKAVQAYIQCKYFRSKSTQTIVKLRNAGTSPTKTSSVSVALSPFIINKVSRRKPSTSGITNIAKRLFVEEDKSDSDVSILALPLGQESSPSIPSVLLKTTSDSSSLNEEDAKIQKENNMKLALNCTLLKIAENPRFYIGLPKECYFFIELLTKHTKIPSDHVLLCLKKIRLDTKFTELADEFGISTSYASKIFLKYIPILANFLKSFIVELEKTTIKTNLPIAFRHRYNKVTCIIDCFEIEIQKPSKSVHQALSWSEYKKANTIKYLISSTPDGAVSYVSEGYGGRISDTLLVEKSNFLQQLSPGSFILADRGFKNIEQLLSQHGSKLLRPPSVTSGSKLTKHEARRTKEIASLRIHIERVIRRLREFSLLKPHSVVNNNIIRVMDNCVTISCALINLQDSLIKK